MDQNLCSPPDNLDNKGSEKSATTVTPLLDDVLSAAGLKKVTAYVRGPSSPNAERVKRSREKAAESGITQVNVRAPIALHQTVKDVAAALQNKRDARQALEALLTAEVNASQPGSAILVDTQQQIDAFQHFVLRMSKLTGWRRFVARLLGLL